MPLTLDGISDLIGSRRYCFVIMPFGGAGSFYRELADVVERQCGLCCVRADDVPPAEPMLLEKVHQLIDNAELVLADLSEARPNLYYEVGYAKARGKRVLIVCHRGTEFAVDLQGIERIEYEDTRDGVPHFHAELKRHIMALVESDRLLLRSMLVAPRSLPSYLLASPRWHTARTLSEATRERRTYGDYLGVVGIVSAFGALLGQEGVPELISAKHADRSLLDQDCNLYLIGSSRANDLTDAALALIQRSAGHPWRFESLRRERKTRLVGLVDGRPWEHVGDHRVSVPDHDYGLLIRGPHPAHDGRLIMVLAGTRSLGTGGVCLAATRPRLLQKIRDKLGASTLADRTKLIWVLVRAIPDPADNHASVDYTDVQEAGTA